MAEVHLKVVLCGLFLGTVTKGKLEKAGCGKVMTSMDAGFNSGRREALITKLDSHLVNATFQGN